MINSNFVNFENLGYSIYQLEPKLLDPIKKEIYEIKQNFNNHKNQSAKSELAGNIQHEYLLKNSHQYLEDLLIPFLIEYDKQFNYFWSIDVNNNKCPIVLSNSWVNYQSKYEFNPIHRHSGIFSFVIWIQVPYTLEEENKVAPGLNSNNLSSGLFEFLYPSTHGGIFSSKINIDKTMENTLVVFPSHIYHQVYPFYSSDDYRISVSGNFKFNIK